MLKKRFKVKGDSGGGTSILIAGNPNILISVAKVINIKSSFKVFQCRKIQCTIFHYFQF